MENSDTSWQNFCLVMVVTGSTFKDFITTHDYVDTLLGCRSRKALCILDGEGINYTPRDAQDYIWE